MQRVTGIGGIFFKTKDVKKLSEWYARHLGIEQQEGSGFSFKWREDEEPHGPAITVWSLFPHDTKYFDPGNKSFMINYRVKNLAQLLEQLRSEGVEVHGQIEEVEYGRFAWISDPDGNRIELWEPTGELSS
jgi:predicted enzyme related to lactoylglutathione lyase